MRLQKAITESGIASRREAEAIIQEGRVTVNNVVIYHPAHEIEEGDYVAIDGDPIPKAERKVYFAYHKPKGLIVDRNDPQHRPSIFSQLKQLPIRVESVDKLDIQTTGLLILTNDGDIAHNLMAPTSSTPRKYLVKIWKKPDDRRLQMLKNGVFLDDGKTKPIRFRIVEETDTNNIWMEVLVTESRHRLLKRVFDKIGHPISKIKRISFATIAIGKLEPGEVRMLTGEEVRRLKDISEGIDPRNAGNKSKYKKGFARPKPKKNARKKKIQRDLHRPQTKGSSHKPKQIKSTPKPKKD